MAKTKAEFPWELPPACREAPIAYVEVEIQSWQRTSGPKGSSSVVVGCSASSAFFDARPWLGKSGLAGGARSARARFERALPDGLELARWDALGAPSGGLILAVLLEGAMLRAERGANDKAQRAATAAIRTLGEPLSEVFEPVVSAMRMISGPERDWTSWSVGQIERHRLEAVVARLEERALREELAAAPRGRGARAL